MLFLPKNSLASMGAALLVLMGSSYLPDADAALQVGDNICTEGFIMDFFCIERGTLLDAPSVVTLQNPEAHSVHCLVDVPSCVGSPFEVLLDPAVSGDLYARGWRLDENSKQRAVEVAQGVSTCSTCDPLNNELNSHVRGFRAALNAVITNLNQDDPSTPPEIQILDIMDTTAYTGTESACQTFFGMQDIVDKANEAEAPNDATDQALADEGASAVDSDASLQEGDTICTEGFIMDSFCIDRGTLLDAPNVVTLANPELHSIHCLIDVNSCVTSPFEVLVDPAEQGGLYNRGWRLDTDSQAKAVALAKGVGSCTDCDPLNTPDNSHVKGFRAAMTAIVTSLNQDDASIPPTITIQQIEDTTAYSGTESPCQAFFGMENINDQLSAPSSSTGGGGGGLLDGLLVDASTDTAASTLRTKHVAHASLMMVSWGFLLPSGTLIAKFYKHRPDGLWFKIHRGLQILGLLIAIIGWSIALRNFNVFKDYGFRNFQHGICGMVVMILGLLQPLNALFRPHAPKDESEAKTKKRKLWEIWHKSSGWGAVLLAIPTIVLGTLSLPNLDDQTKFQIGYGAGCGGGLLLLVACLFFDKTTYQQQASPSKEEGTTEQAA